MPLTTLHYTTLPSPTAFPFTPFPSPLDVELTSHVVWSVFWMPLSYVLCQTYWTQAGISNSEWWWNDGMDDHVERSSGSYFHSCLAFWPLLLNCVVLNVYLKFAIWGDKLVAFILEVTPAVWSESLFLHLASGQATHSLGPGGPPGE